ncbi:MULTISPECIES: DivIVA domain-containing protein [Terrabacteria group]|uniref:DivIVA domain-containing protein n=1 Tax=Bacillati TaxID=1783272 RepID=UPI0019397D53|nr:MULTISPECIES: DivIVA domain-containing protein [Terrabacteria group]MBW9212081.1 DivIVA domain-containing protein [Trueperella sp. zg.1013]QRG87113.1 DivIVA domain-containing protein [Bulleidia sp. zg-1006]
MAKPFHLDPIAIVEKRFDIDFKGYNAYQVDGFFDLVIKDYQTYERLLQQANERLQDLERTNASLRAKLIDLEGRLKVQEASEENLPTGMTNVDVLKRLSRLEKEVFRK